LLSCHREQGFGATEIRKESENGKYKIMVNTTILQTELLVLSWK
jgi:hypothetical protein